MPKTVTLTIPARILDEWVPKFEDRDDDPEWEPGEDETYRKMMAALGEGWRRPVKHIRIEATWADCKEVCDECDFSINPAYGKDRLVHPETKDDRATLKAYRRLLDAAIEGALALGRHPEPGKLVKPNPIRDAIKGSTEETHD